MMDINLAKLSKRYYVDRGISDFWTIFEEDRDRIIHSSAFRRLRGKAQVFFRPGNDHVRTRLTHSIDVAFIACTLARVFQVNGVLAETIALAHDLGHPPFGHFGEYVLSSVSQEKFDHNIQTMRLVTKLETISPAFNGLNLCYGTLQGLLQHHDGVVPESLYHMAAKYNIDPSDPPLVEAMIATLSDDIAYLSHDVEDAIKSGVLTLDQLCYHVQYIKEIYRMVNDQYMKRLGDDHQGDNHVDDLLKSQLVSTYLRSGLISDVIHNNQHMPAFSKTMHKNITDLKAYLMDNFYNSKTLANEKIQAKTILTGLLTYYKTPLGFAKIPKNFHHTNTMRCIVDYISGMSDQYAYIQYQKFIA